jgi:hypothetical protein
LLFSEALVKAIIHRRVKVHIPHSAAIHEDVPLKVLREKGAWD